MNRIKASMAVLSVAATLWANPEKVLNLTSPNGLHRISVAQRTVAEGVRRVEYRVSYQDKEVIAPSQAGLELDNWAWEMALGFRKLPHSESWMDSFEVDSVRHFSQTDNRWQPLFGDRSEVRDCYNAATFYMSKKDGSRYRLNIEARAYNEGVAFRYFFPEHPQAIFHKVVADLTEYTLPAGTSAYAEDWAQTKAVRKPIDEITRPVERALTLQLPNGLWSALLEADVDDWCLTKFKASETKRNTLTSVMYSPVDIVTYYATPWRIIMTADRPGQLLENNTMAENLNPPCAIKNTDWIKPGTIMREVTITTEGALATIDFCAKHNIPYMLFDWLWYLPCTSHDGDATRVVAKLDMPRVVAYGKEKGVGVWVYVNQHALMKQMHELFPLLHQWGIVGVKSGFVQYASHRWSVWLHDMIRLAAQNQLMINIHDEYRPTGFSRTYPNLMTQEGILGNEEFPDATHNVTLPFTRMINGAADYTICYYDKRIKTTHAHQLAASLVFYSPLQTIFWYDKPSFANDEPELEWFDHLKTTFDESRVLEGMPGENIVMARRNGEQWFVGAMTNNSERTQSVNLSFLDPSKNYVAYLYTDGGDEIKSRTKVRCSYRLVNARQTLTFSLRASGGAAVRLVPIDNKNEMKKYKKYKGEVL